MQEQWWYRLHGGGGGCLHGGRGGCLHGRGGGCVGGIGQHSESGDLINDKQSTMASNSNGKSIRPQFIVSLGGSTTTGRS